MRDPGFERWLRGQRKKIDRENVTLLRSLRRRLKMSEEVGVRKFRAGVPIVDRAREAEVFRKTRGNARRIGLDPRIATDFMWFLLRSSREVQRRRLSRLRARKWF
jgi:chorismate mutase